MSTESESAQLNDAELVRRVQQGDHAAFEGLVLRHQDRLFCACVRLIGDRETARDLAQEAFVRAFEAIGRFEHKSGFYTWLFRIAMNLGISQRRKQRRVVLQAADTMAETVAAPSGGAQALRLQAMSHAQIGGAAEHLSTRERHAAVLRALAELDDEQRTILVLRELESYDYQAIADLLGVPIGTVRSRLHRARLALRDRLGPLFEQAG